MFWNVSGMFWVPPWNAMRNPIHSLGCVKICRAVIGSIRRGGTRSKIIPISILRFALISEERALLLSWTCSASFLCFHNSSVIFQIRVLRIASYFTPNFRWFCKNKLSSGVHSVCQKPQMSVTWPRCHYFVISDCVVSSSIISHTGVHWYASICLK